MRSKNSLVEMVGWKKILSQGNDMCKDPLVEGMVAFVVLEGKPVWLKGRV